MRIEMWKIISASCLVLTLLAGGKILAAEAEMEKQEQLSPGPPPVPDEAIMDKQFEPTAERIEKILAEIKEHNPQKAEELMQLREKDPNAFRLELRKTLRAKFREEMKEQMREMPMLLRGGEEVMMKAREMQRRNPWMGRGGPGMMQEWMKDKPEEYMKWLMENYPDEATKLKELKDQDFERYTRAVMVRGRKYWPIFEASKDNPRLAELLKEQLALKEQRAELIKQIKATTDEKEKQQLTADLEKILGQSFDLIVKRKQLACDDLTKKLTELQKEVVQKKAEIEKWKSKEFKNDKVKQRINELLSEKEKFEWD
jgi:hypothetical protein